MNILVCERVIITKKYYKAESILDTKAYIHITIKDEMGRRLRYLADSSRGLFAVCVCACVHVLVKVSFLK